MPYAKNKTAVAICNRSGFKYPREELIEDGYLRGLLVHITEYDPYHPQERPFDPDEGIAIYRPAPDLMPVPPSAVLAIAGNVLTWTQPNPPGSTVVNWQVWRSTNAGVLYTQLATVTPPAPSIIQPADQIPKFDGTPSGGGLVNSSNVGQQTGTFTDAAGASGFRYYIVTLTADTSNTQSPNQGPNGLVSAPSNVVIHA